jgi:hypothetical protein
MKASLIDSGASAKKLSFQLNLAMNACSGGSQRFAALPGDSMPTNILH